MSIKSIGRPKGYAFPIGLTRNAITLSTGGDITEEGLNVIHTFTTSGNLVTAFTGSIEYLVVAGEAGSQPDPSLTCAVLPAL